MPSSKKQRGRQRKASAAASRAEDIWRQLPASPEQLLTGLRQGDNNLTWTVAAILGEDRNGGPTLHREVIFRFRRFMLDKDIIQIVLDFLVQCENSELRGVMTNAQPFSFLGPLELSIELSTPTPLSAPSPWLGILVNITRDKGAIESETRKTRMQIARNFGPVVRCMCDASGQFFQSNLHWFNSVFHFICLVSNLACTREAIPNLLQYKGLIEFMVQSIFWESHRPDIVEEAGRVHSIDFQFIADKARAFISRISNLEVFREDVPDKNVRRCLKAIGTSRIAARSATPAAGRKSELYVLYLIAHIKSKHLGKARNSEEGKVDYYFSFRTLESLMIGGCVDKDVIAGVISLANHGPLDYDDVFSITAVLIKMLVPVDEVTVDNFGKPPYDNLFAYAVDQGLIEACLRLLVEFKHVLNASVLDGLQALSQTAIDISMSMKSSKAFIRQHSRITKVIQQKESQLSGSSQQCQEIFRRIKMIMHLKENIKHYAAAKCCRCCGKVLTQGDLKQCSGCMQAIYCSQGCQEEDWSQSYHDWSSHQHCCNDRRTAALETNIHAVVNKLMAENHSSLLAQAVLRGVDILHCIVIIDLRVPSIKLMPSEGFLELTPSECRDSFTNMAHRNQSAGFVTSMCNFYSCHAKRRILIKKHKLANDSWQDAQARFSKNGELLDEIHRDRKVRESLGPFFCEWYHSGKNR